MAHPSKIATCCHCGTRAMLRLDAGHHTLSCGACGAPLKRLKMLPSAAPAPKPAITHQPEVYKSKPKPAYAKPPKRSKRQKKRKSLFRKFAEEAFDLVEDIFD